MFNILQFYEAGKTRKSIIKIPFADTLHIVQRISTRTGNLVFKWGDGTETAVTTVKNNDYTVNQGTDLVSKTYASTYTGDVEVIANNAVNDIYSLYVAFPGNILGASNQTKTNIQDFGTFINQFKNLYSFVLNVFTGTDPAKMPIIKGNLMQFPDSVERVYIEAIEVVNAPTDLSIDLNGLSATSKLKWFNQGTFAGAYNVAIKGDIAKLPISCYFFKITSGVINTSAITYTSGKVWASAFDTLDLPTTIPLNTTANNAILADMAASVTSAIGGKVIKIGGYRTASSTSAVNYLTSLGFTVDVTLITERLILPLSSNYLDISGNSNNAVAVGSPVFESGALRTSLNNYATVADNDIIDMGTSSYEYGCDFKINSYTSGFIGIFGKTIYGPTDGRYGVFIESGILTAMNQMNSLNIQNTIPVSTVNDGQWHSVRCVCNRTTGQQFMYIDNVLINITTFTPVVQNINHTGKFFIGAYGNSTGSTAQANSGFNGWIKNIFFHKT